MSDVLRSPKIQTWHLDRTASVYVRQSTPQQVTDHQESTARQYALAERAVALVAERGHVGSAVAQVALDAPSAVRGPARQRARADEQRGRCSEHGIKHVVLL